MESSYSKSYKDAGVDVTAGYEGVRLMKEDVESTKIPGVLSKIGGFGGLFELDLNEYKNPVLVSGTDGVGTKLKIAFLMDKHDTVGIDCVAMCVNDIICAGAKPLIFLDYIALGKNIPQKVASIVKGVANGCRQAGCALIGGETAEMPGFYPDDEYDLAGYCTGVVDKARIIDSSSVSEGDIVIGIKSSGVHSNGFSLVRKVFDINRENLDVYYEELNQTLGEALLTPTKIYVKPMLDLISKVRVKAISHITGGGFYENLPRMLPEDKNIVIEKVEVLPIFKLIEQKGNIPKRDMFNTFNMGIGMAFVVSKEDVDVALDVLKNNNEEAYVIGRVENGSGEVEIC